MAEPSRRFDVHGFEYVGSTIVYARMHAVGVNDHAVGLLLSKRSLKGRQVLGYMFDWLDVRLCRREPQLICLPTQQRHCATRAAHPRLEDMTRPEWITRAHRVATSIKADTTRARGSLHSVYVILLHDPRGLGKWGLYVGQTAREPDLRFDQHKAGYKASSAVRRFGVRLLPELVEHLNPMMGWESLDIEAAMADAFRRAGILWIEGGH